MDLLVSASVFTSFFAGVAALFAPCCVSVLLPAYLASVFRERRTVFLMTFVYFLGLLLVFLPIGLGAAFLASFFSDYHSLVYSLGAIFLITLGVVLLLGIHFSLPFQIVSPKLNNTGLGPVFILGIFSGIATTCCAPVLAGVIALSAMPGSYFLSGVYTLAYVLGMVTPLFVLSLVFDQSKLLAKMHLLRRSFNYQLLSQKFRVTVPNLVSGLMFLGLGTFILFSAISGQLQPHITYQLEVNILLTRVIQFFNQLTKFLPELVWSVLFLAVFLVMILAAFRQFKNLGKEIEE